MSANSPVGIKDQKERPNFLVEVSNAEKQLWALIQTKGLLQFDVQESYRKICSSYEKILLNVPERELQDVEYSLWKLHYKHIDEFRKIIKRSSTDSENINSLAPQNVAAAKRSSDNHVNRFNSFISEASEFYSSLIVKLRTCYGLPEELSMSEGGCMFTSLEQKKVRTSQFLCHRFLVCLGDLARYREQYGKPGVEKHNWSIAASHYLEATMIWPDSGNPQNQLAVLATYVGDEFLALYHCIRSLAVKEPFPDAWNNLILLFERNRTSHLISLDSDSGFDFLKPYERGIAQAKSHSCDDNSNNNVVKAAGNGLEETNMWPLIIVSTSFFFVESRLEDFPKAFASTVEMLDALMVLDDTRLKAALESYQCMGSARAGPFRALQVVSIFIFVIDNLFKNTKVNSSKDKDDMQQLELVQLAMAATFVFMGRFVDRCLKANKLISFPLLPAVLVFVEWLVNVLDQAERYGTDDKSLSAMSYFFGAFIQLLKKLGGKTSEINSSNSTALWEDYELRGFAPVSCAHASLEFSTQWGLTESFESRAECRAHRIISAATKIAARSSNTRKWISYDEVGNNFGGADFLLRMESVEPSGNDLEVKEPHQHDYRVTERCDIEIVEEEGSSKCSENGKSVAVEEEEVILLKPLTRYNSAPLYGSHGDDQMLSKNKGDQTVPADECLRRATSLLIAQNPAEGDSFTFQSDLSNVSSDKAVKQTESPIKDTTAHPFSEMLIGAGPPSLSSWVLNRVSLSNDREKKNVLNRHGLTPIEESFNDLSVSEKEHSVISHGHESATTYYPSPYSAPVPSAPLLPDDAVWFRSLQSRFSDQKIPSNIGKADSYTDALKDNGFPSWTATHRPVDYGPSVSGFMHGYSPPGGMTSSEWLRKYRESQSLEGVNSHQPVHSYVPRNPDNFNVSDASRSGLSDQRRAPLASNPLTSVDRPPPFYPSFPLVYGVEEQRGRHFNGSERPSPYGYGRMTDFRDDPQPLLNYLKEREWLLRRDPTIRGPAYMGN